MAEAEVLNTAELKSGEMVSKKVMDREILIVRLDDNYYALDARCPHLGGRLASGKLQGTVITCPLHGSQFDVRDGKVIKWTNWTGFLSKVGNKIKSPKSLKTYPVFIKDKKIYIKI